MKNKKIVVGILVVIMLMSLVVGCSSQAKPATQAASNYPTKPITLIIPFAAGGPSDVIGRAIANVSKKYLGEPLVVVNRPGGNTTTGLNEAVTSPPDGYTIVFPGISSITQPLVGDTKYEYVTALEPICQLEYKPQGLIVKANSPFKTLKDLVDYAKAHPNEIKFGHSGDGGPTHLATVEFMQQAGIKMTGVPFEGIGPIMTAFLGDHIQVAIASVGDVKSYLKSGEARMLAVAQEQRVPEWPDIPTYKELGYNVVLPMWDGISAPKGLPADVKEKLVKGFEGICSDPDLKKTLADMSVILAYMGPTDFQNMMIQQRDTFAPIIKQLGIGTKNGAAAPATPPAAPATTPASK
jgi:tripartite-type tricarboxylate transporter receptor subunit TctC